MSDAKDTISAMEESVLQAAPSLFAEWNSAIGTRREMMQVRMLPALSALYLTIRPIRDKLTTND